MRAALGCAAASLSIREEGCRSTFSIRFYHWHHLLLSKIAKEGVRISYGSIAYRCLKVNYRISMASPKE